MFQVRLVHLDQLGLQVHKQELLEILAQDLAVQVVQVDKADLEHPSQLMVLFNDENNIPSNL
jgi:hypothetical protein